VQATSVPMRPRSATVGASPAFATESGAPAWDRRSPSAVWKASPSTRGFARTISSARCSSERRPAHERRPEPRGRRRWWRQARAGPRRAPGRSGRAPCAVPAPPAPRSPRAPRRGQGAEPGWQPSGRGARLPQQLETVPKAHIPGGTPAAPWTDRGAADLPWKRTGEWAGGAPPATATIGGRRAQVDRARRGAIAQLGERLDRTQEVAGSSPASSTPRKPCWRGVCSCMIPPSALR
jgi:hypothetical protein